MRSNSRNFDDAPRRAKPAADTRRATTSAPPRKSHPAPAPGILDRVRDQHGVPWIRFGTPERAKWVEVSNFAQRGVFTDLAKIDTRLIVPEAQGRLRHEIGQSDTYRPALVATSPGFIEHHFVLGDGQMLSPRTDNREIIVAFETQSKFAARGTLKDWQAVTAPFVMQQTYFLFALALAFVGCLLPFVPPDYMTVFFELVGDPGRGKSLSAMLAVSAWAGDPKSSVGGGETWNISPEYLDTLKARHCNTLLLLDEANSASSSPEARRQLVQKAIFSLTATGMRQRYGEPSSDVHAQLAIISTSNSPLCDIITGSPAEKEAMHQRMITIEIAKERPYGIFDRLPAGYDTAAEAAEALRATINAQWGTAGPAFVRRMQRELANDEQQFRHVLARGLAYQRQRLSAVTNKERIVKCFALVAVSGLLAQRWCIVPSSWGNPVAATRAVARDAMRAADPLFEIDERLYAYVAQNRSSLVEVAQRRGPLTEGAFKAAAGFLLADSEGVWLRVHTERFQQAFPAPDKMMRALRDAGRARTEGGVQKKLTIKTPRSICDTGRVYCVRIDSRPAWVGSLAETLV